MIESCRRQLVEFTRELVAARSPSGSEDGAAAAAARWMSTLGFDRVVVDELGSVWGSITGARDGRRVLLDGHLDTVEVGDEDQWAHDPFGTEEVQGRLYGRGTSDMKGALAAMILAAADFAADCARDFSGDILVSCTVCEEIFEGIAARRMSAELRPEWVILGEASDLNLNRGQRGRAELWVHTEGKTAHSSNPGAGRNAVYDMMHIVQKLQGLTPRVDSFLGEGIMELTDICSEPYPGRSMVPELCKATYDRRLLPGEDRESVLGQVNSVLEKIGSDDPGPSAGVQCARDEITCYTGVRMAAERFFPAWVIEEDHLLVEAAAEGLRRAGLSPQVSHYSFCTNGSHYAGERGLPSIGFGPSPEQLAHITDEYVLVEDLVSAYKGYRGMLEVLMS